MQLDQPHLYEIEDMIAFCKKYERIYILGASENQEYLLKFFDACDIKIDGYAVTSPEEQNLKAWRKIPIVAVDDVIKSSNTGIILGLSDKHYRCFIPKFKNVGFKDYFVMTEYNKITIAKHLRPCKLEDMHFEYKLVDHCNLACQNCDHFSQLANKHCVELQVFERDMCHLAELFEHNIGHFTLTGGEPLLHNDIIECLRISRQQFPNSNITLLTNGLLLPKLEKSDKGNIYEVLEKYSIKVVITIYPLNFNYEELEQKAKEYNVQLWASNNIHSSKADKDSKISDKHTMKLEGNAAVYGFCSCLYLNYCNCVHDGKRFPCPRTANIYSFNKAFDKNLELTDSDFIDIYKINNWKELSEFSSNRIPFCRYCDVKNWHYQYAKWKPSTKKIEEYV